jgi:hypothetical protein
MNWAMSRRWLPTGMDRQRFASVASIINRFYERLHGEDRTTPYPAAAVEVAWTSSAK